MRGALYELSLQRVGECARGVRIVRHVKHTRRQSWQYLQASRDHRSRKSETYVCLAHRKTMTERRQRRERAGGIAQLIIAAQRRERQPAAHFVPEAPHP